MRVISKFHDYYDSCLQFGQDSNVVYLRDRLEFDTHYEKTIPEPFKSLLSRLEKYIKRRLVYSSMLVTQYSMFHSLKGGSVVEITPFIVVFCGKVYKGYRVSSAVEVKYFYSAETISAYLTTLGCDPNKATGKYSRSTYMSTAYEWFNGQGSSSELEYLVAHKISITYLCPTNRSFVINPNLRELEFFKVYPPYEAFQELDMWISGTLAYPHNPVIELSEKDRVQQHGFDPKYGFRTRPKG